MHAIIGNACNNGGIMDIGTNWLKENNLEVVVCVPKDRDITTLALTQYPDFNAVVCLKTKDQVVDYFRPAAFNFEIIPDVAGVNYAIANIAHALRRQIIYLDHARLYNASSGRIKTNLTTKSLILGSLYGKTPSKNKMQYSCTVLTKPTKLSIPKLPIIKQLLQFGLLREPVALSKYFKSVNEVLPITCETLLSDNAWLHQLKHEFASATNSIITNLESELVLG